MLCLLSLTSKVKLPQKKMLHISLPWFFFLLCHLHATYSTLANLEQIATVCQYLWMQSVTYNKILQGAMKVVMWKSPVLTVCTLNKIPKSVSLSIYLLILLQLSYRQRPNPSFLMKGWTKLIFLLLLVVKSLRGYQ